MKLSPAYIHHSRTPTTCNGQNCKNYPQSLGNICVDKSLLSLFVLNMNFLKDLQLYLCLRVNYINCVTEILYRKLQNKFKSGSNLFLLVLKFFFIDMTTCDTSSEGNVTSQFSGQTSRRSASF